MFKDDVYTSPAFVTELPKPLAHPYRDRDRSCEVYSGQSDGCCAACALPIVAALAVAEMAAAGGKTLRDGELVGFSEHAMTENATAANRTVSLWEVMVREERGIWRGCADSCL